MNKEKLLNVVIETHNYLIKCEVKGQSVFDLANAMARTQTLIEELSKEEEPQSLQQDLGSSMFQMPPYEENEKGDENVGN